MPWSVIQTHPGACAGDYAPNAAARALPLVLRNLVRQGFEFYNPRFLQRTRPLGKPMIERRVQLFPNYMFVRIIDQWYALRSTFGVSNVLMSSDARPAFVDDEVVETLRAKENSDGCVVLNKSKFQVGQTVQVKSGPFAYELGLYDGQRDRDRVYVLLSLLGTQRRVEVKEDNLVAA